MYFLVDELEALFLRHAMLPDEMLEPMVDCVLAHELVHALQHEGGMFGDSQLKLPEDMDPFRDSLIEGHAEWVSQKVCDPAAKGFFDLIQGAAGIWESRESPVTIDYVIAPLYFETHARTAEEGWALIDNPPGSDFSAVVTTYQARAAALGAKMMPLERMLMDDSQASHSLWPRGVLHVLGVLDAEGFALGSSLEEARTVRIQFGGIRDAVVSVLQFSDPAIPEAILAGAKANWRVRSAREGDVHTFRYDNERRYKGLNGGLKETYHWAVDGNRLISVCIDQAPISIDQARKAIRAVLSE